MALNPDAPTIDIVVEDLRWEAAGISELATRAVRATLSFASLDPSMCSVSILACDDARIAALNKDFRAKARPTNVLSWPETDLSSETPGARPDRPIADPDGTHSLGDIAIAFETCTREAEAADKTLGDHALHLIVHGTLHLLGYDHTNDADAALMEGIEVDILGELGLADPY